uniref:F-box domain-containing protein n=1 Tax=Caenorhabditis tropicalis TaxID=1561998 RepID=A0A1I7TBH3_9PELO
MSIPLQKLPYLAQKEVLSTMKLKEIFKLASLSKKNARIVKACLNDQRFILTVCSTDDSWHIESESSDDIHEYSSEKCRGVFLDKTVYEVLEFIVKVFNKPKICVDFAEDIGKFHNYSRFFESLGLKIDKVSVDRCKQGELQNMKLEIRGRICFMIQQKNNGPKAIVLKEQDSVQLETQFELT